MTSTEPRTNAGDLLVLRRRILHQRDLFVVLPVVGVCIAGMAMNPRLAYQPAMVITLFAGAEAWVQARVRLTVSVDEVTVRDLPGPNGSAQRTSVAAIHRYSYWLLFTGYGGETVLRSRPYWTTGQLLDVAKELAVPLYDHRTWFGLSHVAAGRKITPPAT